MEVRDTIFGKQFCFEIRGKNGKEIEELSSSGLELQDLEPSVDKEKSS